MTYSRPMSWALLRLRPAGGRRRIRSRPRVPEQVGQVRGAARELPDLRRALQVVAEGLGVLAQPAGHRLDVEGVLLADRARLVGGAHRVSMSRPCARQPQSPARKYAATERGSRRPGDGVRRDTVARPVADGRRRQRHTRRRARSIAPQARSTTSQRVPLSPCRPSATHRPLGVPVQRGSGRARLLRRVGVRLRGACVDAGPTTSAPSVPVSWE